MPFYYYDGKKVDYNLMVDPDGTITTFSVNNRGQGSGRILGDRYTNLEEVKSRIIDEWSKVFYYDNDEEKDEKKNRFIQNLDNKLSQSQNKIDLANRLLHHILTDVHKIDTPEGAERISNRRETDIRSGLNVDPDHTGQRWFEGESMRNRDIVEPNYSGGGDWIDMVLQTVRNEITNPAQPAAFDYFDPLG